MCDIDLNQAFGPTPDGFHQRVEQTLLTLKEKPMKRISTRTLVLAIILVLALAGIAYAAIQMGQEWYFANRYPNYQEHSPQQHQAILAGLQRDVQQEVIGVATQMVDVQVMDVAWVPQKDLMTISITARAKDEATYELHSLWEMDVDGATVGRIDPEDEESRLFHWLWTEKGFGLPQDVMADPGKMLLLVDLMEEIYIDDAHHTPLMASRRDSFTTQEGTVMHWRQYDFDYIKLSPRAKEAIEAARAGDGLLTLRLPFTARLFMNNAFMYADRGEVMMRVRVDGKE